MTRCGIRDDSRPARLHPYCGVDEPIICTADTNLEEVVEALASRLAIPAHGTYTRRCTTHGDDLTPIRHGFEPVENDARLASDAVPDGVGNLPAARSAER